MKSKKKTNTSAKKTNARKNATTGRRGKKTASKKRLGRESPTKEQLLELLIKRMDGQPELWNDWRAENPDRELDLSEADLSSTDLSYSHLGGVDLSNAHLTRALLCPADLTKANLSGALLSEADLSGAHLSNADLNGAHLIGTVFDEADLRGADLREAIVLGGSFVDANLAQADLRKADLSSANFTGANLTDAKLSGADLTQANLSGANLRKANLTDADLRRAVLVETNCEQANLSNCRVHGISAWDLNLTATTQNNLVISQEDQPAITVDNLEVAQFVYLLLNYRKLRDVFDTITSKAVLILGRFTPKERRGVLDAIRDELRNRDYLPVLFDLERPATRDYTETVTTLAGLARFIIVDLSEPSSVPLEAHATMPNLMIPFVPIIREGERPFSMFVDLQRKYNEWVLDVVSYKNKRDLVSHFEKIIKRAEEKTQELAMRKTEQPWAPTPVDELE